MSYQDQYGNPTRQTDEYGNPARQTDEYGNPTRQTDEYGNPARQTDKYGNPARQTDEYGNPARQTDEYGNPARQTDEYGNPVHHAGGTGTYGTTYTSGTTTAPMTGSGYGEGQQPMHRQKHHGHQDEYGNPARQTDEYGNPSRQTDEYGNPVPQIDQYGNSVHRTGGTGTYGTTYTSGTTTAPVTGSGYGKGQQPMHRQEHHGHQDQYGNPARQTDEYGNPARQTDEFGNPVPQTDQYGYPDHHTVDQPYGTGQYQEKKGTMEKIRDKLSGHY